MKKQILLFEINDAQLKQKIRRALLPLKLHLQIIDPMQYALTLGELITTSSTEMKAEAVTTSETPDVIHLPAPMIVFAGLSSQELDNVLKSLRQQRIFLPYKAVLTQHNAAWTSYQLFEELQKEHERMQQLKNSQE